MNNVVFGKKLGMGEAYIGHTRVAVTKIALMPMTVSQLKTVEKDGYASAQVAFDTPNKKSNKALLGHLKPSKAVAKRMKEVHVEGLEIGAVISPADHISVGTIVNIQGTSKGKGFAGVMKRWNFAGGPRTHGQSDRGRAPGSIGQGTTPGRVHKGKKMAGRMGSDTKTVKNAVVVYFDPSSNIAWVTGPVPGTVSGIVRLTTMGTKEIESVTYNSATQVVAEGVGVTLPAQAGLAVTQDAVEEAQAPAQSEPKADKETTQ